MVATLRARSCSSHQMVDGLQEKNFPGENIVSQLLGVPTFPRSVVFFDHFFDGFLKKRVNVCRDKIRQNNA